MDSTRVIIESLAQGGDGVAHLPDGRAVFVGGSCPGDEASIVLTEEHPRWARATISDLIAPSPDRVAPPCPYFGTCGGCQWQHVAYPRQLAAKRQTLIDTLTRIGGLPEPPVADIFASPAEYGYRNKVELTPTTANGKFALGFVHAGTNQVVPVQSCMLLPGRAAGLPKALSGALRFLASRGAADILRAAIRVAGSGEVAIDIWTPGGAFPRTAASRVIAEATGAKTITRTILKGELARHDISQVEVLAGPGAWRERLDRDNYIVSAPSFFQVNSRAAALLRAEALRALEPDGTMRVADLYAGVGTFTLPLCRAAGAVVAAESSRFALADLRTNLKSAGLDADVVPGDAAYAIPDLGHLDAAIIDPPRSGLSDRAMTALTVARIPRIVYVSCDPATLARDTQRLAVAGYTASLFAPFDLFPQTYHLETLAVFNREASPGNRVSQA